MLPSPSVASVSTSDLAAAVPYVPFTLPSYENFLPVSVSKKTASLKSFYQENEISDNDLNCEFEGVLGTTASIVGTTQANEALKMIMKIGQTLKNQILIIDLLNLNFRKVKFNRK